MTIGRQRSPRIAPQGRRAHLLDKTVTPTTPAARPVCRLCESRFLSTLDIEQDTTICRGCRATLESAGIIHGTYLGYRNGCDCADCRFAYRLSQHRGQR